MALDGKGNLLVSDPANNRVVVISEQTGKQVGAFAVQDPDCVGADPKSGAVYVTRRLDKGRGELVRFKGWKEPTATARVELGRNSNPQMAWLMAVDSGGERPIVWLGSYSSGLLRVEDPGPDATAFATPQRIGSNRLAAADFNDISVDRLHNEVYFRLTKFGYWRFSEASGKLERYNFKTHGSFSQQLVPGFDEAIYVHGYPRWLGRFDRDGKPTPGAGAESHIRFAVTDMYVNIGHQLAAAWDGSVCALINADPKRPRFRRTLGWYGPDGTITRWGPLWQVSEVAVGPKFDPQGNIYIAEQVRPKGWVSPDGLEQSAYLYGSIVKFSPKGGRIEFKEQLYPEGVKPALAPDLAAVDADYIFRFDHDKLLPVKVTGAEWIAPGVSHIEHASCTCESIRFDVDGYGRVFYPDLCRFRVGVLDTNGNAIAQFGGYGNADSKGPDIALAWLVGVGVTDDYAYMGDVLNRRLVRAKLTYQAEASCQIK